MKKRGEGGGRGGGRGEGVISYGGRILRSPLPHIKIAPAIRKITLKCGTTNLYALKYLNSISCPIYNSKIK
jgi:hypothetical protein